MDSIHIHGQIPLQGQVRIQGSKNAALPIMAATILIKGTSYIDNCPRIADVFSMQTLLQALGCVISWEGRCIKIDASKVQDCKMPKEIVKGMRSSQSLLGSMISRIKEAVMDYPGGCVIGDRPMDLHVNALQEMGVCFQEADGMLYAHTRELKGGNIKLPFPSVGATENIILAAVLAEGETRLNGAAREPEVVALCQFLQKAGACIDGIGTETLIIQGVESLQGVHFQIPPDRIVAGTYLFGCLIAGGSVLLKEAPTQHMNGVLEVASQMGAVLHTTKEGLYVQAPDCLISPEYVFTDVYPGFPTDLQSPLLAALAVAEGACTLEERIFENRFRIADYLCRMGGCISIKDRKAFINGVPKLCGAVVSAEELRGGAALVMAGLGASGHTVVQNCCYICRGYENIGKDLRELGARVYSV